MASYRLRNMAVTIEKDGSGHLKRRRSLLRSGRYSEITTPDYEFQFNLRGEIQFIRGLGTNWPHPSECLKRTDGNDWVFYSVSATQGIIDLLGEYYLPGLPYPSNSLWDLNPYSDVNAMRALGAWSMVFADINEALRGTTPPEIHDFFSLLAGNDESALYEKSETLNSILGTRISVLPPDTRRANYQFVPLIIADGCRYQCKFCCVKSRQRFRPRTPENVGEQIDRLKAFYGRDLANYDALFLGNHDALGAGEGLIRRSVDKAAKAFGFERSPGGRPLLFLFGSVDSLLEAGNGLLEELNRLPFYTYINIGFESVDPPTLASIGKPLEISRLRDGLQKMIQLNRECANLEITANFLLGETLSSDHDQSLSEWLQSVPPHRPSQGDISRKKGAVYLSPMKGSRNSFDLIQTFYRIKRLSRLPTYLYLIQRL